MPPPEPRFIISSWRPPVNRCYKLLQLAREWLDLHVIATAPPSYLCRATRRATLAGDCCYAPLLHPVAAAPPLSIGTNGWMRGRLRIEGGGRGQTGRGVRSHIAPSYFLQLFFITRVSYSYSLHVVVSFCNFFVAEW